MDIGDQKSLNMNSQLILQPFPAWGSFYTPIGRIMLWRCLSVHLSVCLKIHHSCAITQKALQLSASNLVYFQGHRGHKGQIRFLEHNCKGFRAINLKLDTDSCIWSGKMPIHFGGTGSILGSLGSILASRSPILKSVEHNLKKF